MSSAPRWPRRGTRSFPPRNASGGTGAGNERHKMPAARKRDLTVPDLVLLSLLSEQPMHGYQANLELERRCIRDWAAISRPQVYYSLEKLAKSGMIRPVSDKTEAAGPERQVFSTSPKGLRAMNEAL